MDFRWQLFERVRRRGIATGLRLIMLRSIGIVSKKSGTPPLLNQLRIRPSTSSIVLQRFLLIVTAIWWRRYTLGRPNRASRKHCGKWNSWRNDWRRRAAQLRQHASNKSLVLF